MEGAVGEACLPGGKGGEGGMAETGGSWVLGEDFVD